MRLFILGQPAVPAAGYSIRRSPAARKSPHSCARPKNSARPARV
jgi:hypothetical protein